MNNPKIMFFVRVDPELDAAIRKASKLSGEDNTSAWARRVLSKAAAQEIRRHEIETPAKASKGKKR